MSQQRRKRRPPVDSRGAVFRRALGNRPLRRALVSYLLFNVAEWGSWIALLVWAYDRDGVRGASVLALLQLVPATVLAPVGAKGSARLTTARALCVGYGVQAATYLATGAVLVAEAPYAVVAVLAAMSATAVTLTRPVHYSLLPGLADTTAELTAGNTASGSVEAVAAAIGPLVSAALISPWGAGGVLLVLGAAMALASALTARATGGHGAASDRRPDVGSDAGSVRAVLGNRTARALSAMVAAEYVLVGMLDILLVVLALDLLSMDDSGPGVLNAALGVGGVLGAGLTVVLVGRARLAPVLVAAAVLTGAPIAITGTAALPVVAIALLLLAGAGKLFVDVAARTLVQRALPDRMLVAIFGVQESTMMGGLAVGSLAAPLLVATVGAQWAFVVAGLFLPAVTLLFWRALRAADASAAVPADVYALLAQVPMLAVLPPRLIERLALEATADTALAGSAVVREGEVGDQFYVLRSGGVEVTQQDRLLRALGPGDWFGELALLRDVPRTATVTATVETDLVLVARLPFLTAVTGVPHSVAVADAHATRYVGADGA